MPTQYREKSHIIAIAIMFSKGKHDGKSSHGCIGSHKGNESHGFKGSHVSQGSHGLAKGSRYFAILSCKGYYCLHSKGKSLT